MDALESLFSAQFDGIQNYGGACMAVERNQSEASYPVAPDSSLQVTIMADDVLCASKRSMDSLTFLGNMTNFIEKLNTCFNIHSLYVNSTDVFSMDCLNNYIFMVIV